MVSSVTQKQLCRYINIQKLFLEGANSVFIRKTFFHVRKIKIKVGKRKLFQESEDAPKPEAPSMGHALTL